MLSSLQPDDIILLRSHETHKVVFSRLSGGSTFCSYFVQTRVSRIGSEGYDREWFHNPDGTWQDTPQIPFQGDIIAFWRPNTLEVVILDGAAYACWIKQGVL